MSETNPFRPTFGASPSEWAGRGVVLSAFRTGIDGGYGNPYRAMVINGHRGMGKTVLLSELEDIARSHGWVALRASGRSQSVDELIESAIPALVHQLNPQPSRRITEVRIAGLGGIGTEAATTNQAVPTLESRLRELHALLQDTGVLITVDEVQDASAHDLATIATAVQNLIRDQLNIAIVMAGLTRGVDTLLELPGTTFLRRAHRSQPGPINHAATTQVLVDTAASTKPFSPEAAHLATEMSRGYPYLIQLIGFLAWNTAQDAITHADVESIRPEVISLMGQQIHAPSVRGLPTRQLEYLRAIASLADESASASSADVARELGVALSARSDTRARLIESGLIDAPHWGKVRLALPYLAEYLRAEPPVVEVD